MTARALLLAAALVAGACGRHAPELVRQRAAPPPAFFIRDVSVLDVTTGTLAPHQDVALDRDRIVRIAPTGGKTPATAETIDGQGLTLLPGLIDMHGHVGNSSEPPWSGAFPDPEANLLAYLYCGVTTVLDPADLASDAFARRDRVRRGELLGPTIYTAGPMVTAPGGHPVTVLQELAPWWIRWYLLPRIVRQVDTPEAGRAAAEEIAGLGADVVKVAVDRIPAEAPRLRNEVLAAVVESARRRGVRTVAHIGTTEDALDAGRAGVAAWMHGVYRDRIPDDALAILAAFRVPMVPTMVVFESYALLGQGARTPSPLEAETVPVRLWGAFDRVPDDFHSSLQPFIAELRPLRPVWRDNVRRLRAAGVIVLAGSDTQSGVFPGAGLHRELALLTEAGMTPAEAIRAATLDAARFLADGKEPDFGVIAEGKRADLLLVEGDPTRDLAALARIRAVIKNGVPLERKPLQEGSETERRETSTAADDAG